MYDGYELCPIPEFIQCDMKREFACRNGACVSREVECDGVDDCGDNSDESIPCGKTQMSRAAINPFAPGKFEWKFRYLIFQII